MSSCALLFMLWLSKFEHANCCWDMGHFGWFIRSDEEVLSGWYDFTKDTNQDFGDRIRYKEGMTNYFTVGKKLRKMDKDDAEISHGPCKLDGKKYEYQEWVSNGKIK